MVGQAGEDVLAGQVLMAGEVSLSGEVPVYTRMYVDDGILLSRSKCTWMGVI